MLSNIALQLTVLFFSRINKTKHLIFNKVADELPSFHGSLSPWRYEGVPSLP